LSRDCRFRLKMVHCSWWLVLVSIIVATCCLTVQGKKTAKEWTEFNDRKIRELEIKEREELYGKNPRPSDKPGMVFATFGPGLSKEKKEEYGMIWQGQLQSAGLRIQIFESGTPDRWICTTVRTRDTFDVVKYLRERSEVMKVTLDATDWWYLPKYQKEYIAEMEQKEKEQIEKEEKEKRAKAKKEERAQKPKVEPEIDLDRKEL